MEFPLITPDISLKTIEIMNEGKIYACKIEIIEELIHINLLLDNKLKYKGKIFLEKIQSQIKTFLDYNINEIFEEINQLDSNHFSIIKDKNKYKLKIEFMILRKKRNIIIDLKENKLNDDMINDLINNYEKIIKEKDNIIFDLKEKIKELEEQLEEKNEAKIEQINVNESIINDKKEKLPFNINLKKPIQKLNFHTNCVNCLAVLNDGRLVSGSVDQNIIIYNKKTYQPDLIIKEHNDYIRCILQLSSGQLASFSADKTIKLFNIKKNNYEILQTLNYHEEEVYKIIEIKNKYLISCSEDKSVIFYFKNNSKYEQVSKITINGSCDSIIQTKENEICYSEYIKNNKYNIYF